MASTSDLVVLAPWKAGIIEADEAITPRTRLALTFQTIFEIRKVARETLEQTAFSDPIDRLEQIHSFRLKALPDAMLLAVTYDAGWLPYARNLWGPAGAFLDLLCCHCEGYRLARDTPLHEWQQWVRKREQVSDIFYAASRQTAADILVSTQAEALQRELADPVAGDLALSGFASLSAEEAAAKFRAANPLETHRQALSLLSVMFRLTRYYGADINGPLGADALTLLRAVHSQLHGWDGNPPEPMAKGFPLELEWYRQKLPDLPLHCRAPTYVPANVQRGVVTGHDADGAARITHGAMLFFSVAPGGQESALRALGGLNVASEAGEDAVGGIFRNLAFTFEGMRRLGLPQDMLEAMPDDFAEGAAARAPQVGDLNAFHPQKWAGLPRNWPQSGGGGLADIALVDVVIQLRIHAPGKPIGLHDPDFPLKDEIDALAAMKGLVLLSVEALAPAGEPGYDHLGFLDGVSQPVLNGPQGKHWSDTVKPDALLASVPGQPLLAGGSFLAVRRMPIDQQAFRTTLDEAASATGMSPDLVAEKLIGRRQDGVSPAHGSQGNDFTYRNDKDGALCPRQSHARRANPREGEVPRIMRRGLSFHADPATGCEHGSMFMAYCADLPQQYEVVLSWLNGGNSSRIGSWAADPLCGVRAAGKGTVMRLLHAGKAVRVTLPAADKAFVKLSWSLYLFAPSIPLVRLLPSLADDLAINAEKAALAERARLLAEGRAIIRRLQAVGATARQWRDVLDEPGARQGGIQRAVWTAIREDHEGQLATPAGHLVGSHTLVLEVLRDDGRRFSVREAGRRIEGSLGKFHLGMDSFTDGYRREAPTCNTALKAICERESFDLARAETVNRLRSLVAAGPRRIDLVRDLFEPVTQEMAPHWFGLPDDSFIVKGGSDWKEIGGRKPRFPGDFWNSSRYAFNPFTSEETRRLSESHGQAVVKAAVAWVDNHNRNLTAPVAKALADDKVSYPENADVGRVLAGAMMGWVSTTLGNAARIFEPWLSSGDLGRARLIWTAEAERSHQRALSLFGDMLRRTLAIAPVPECKHRVVGDQGATLGGKELKPGTFVIVSLESAAAEQAEASRIDSYIPFGMASSTPDTPHGCPGRDLALGHLLGMLVGAMEVVDMRYAARFSAEIRPL